MFWICFVFTYLDPDSVFKDEYGSGSRAIFSYQNYKKKLFNLCPFLSYIQFLTILNCCTQILLSSYFEKKKLVEGFPFFDNFFLFKINPFFVNVDPDLDQYLKFRH